MDCGWEIRLLGLDGWGLGWLVWEKSALVAGGDHFVGFWTLRVSCGKFGCCPTPY
jgi:hypothetical protein